MKKIALIVFLVCLLVTTAMARVVDYISWRSAAIDSSTGVTLTLVESTQNRTITELNIVNRGTVEVFLDVGGDATTVLTTAAHARLGANHTITFEDLPPEIKTVGFKTASGTGTIDVHAIVMEQIGG